MSKLQKLLLMKQSVLTQPSVHTNHEKRKGKKSRDKQSREIDTLCHVAFPKWENQTRDNSSHGKVYLKHCFIILFCFFSDSLTLSHTHYQPCPSMLEYLSFDLACLFSVLLCMCMCICLFSLFVRRCLVLRNYFMV
jgi:hypothetical protein